MSKILKLIYGENVKEFIAKKGFDPSYGARPLRRAIKNLFEDKIAEAILDGKIKQDKPVNISIKQEEIVVE